MICNYDCFHCQYPDCINERLEAADFMDDAEMDRTKKLTKARNDRYRASHKKEVNARSRAWNEAHRERVKETTKKWQQENKQRVAARKRARWAENPEYYRQKQREYRARKKEETSLAAGSAE